MMKTANAINRIANFTNNRELIEQIAAILDDACCDALMYEEDGKRMTGEESHALDVLENLMEDLYAKISVKN